MIGLDNLQDSKGMSPLGFLIIMQKSKLIQMMIAF